ncbi:tetratricopeptide repeat protein [Streptomyces sp. NPDC046985]|uniref:tetratricopeptide repeat protein n=1 Tax=Streptomyces sp. NPDC046985 TaxID=3155377 RepID=UPI0033FD8C67
MEKPQPSPAAAPMTAPRRRRSRPLLLLLALTVAAGALGAVWLTLSARRAPAVPVRPAPGPPRAAVALSALTSGAPAALPELTAVIGDRRRFTRAHPGDALAWAQLGAAYVERGRRVDAADFPAAEEALRTSLRLRPRDNADALTGLAELADQRRDFPEGRARGEEALKLAPGRPAAYGALIDACAGLGDQKAAQSTLEKLLRLPHSPAVRARTAAVYWDRGWREDAAVELSDAAAAATAPAERAAYLARYGRMAWERGDFPASLRSFDEALRLDRDQPDALAGRARTLASLGRTGQALDAYRRALAARPAPETLLELGELLESLGRAAQARTQYGLLRTRVSQDAVAGVDGELVLGRLEADHGDAGSAVRRLRAEWKRQPGTAVADALGWALHRTGNDEEALTFATTATEETKGGGAPVALYTYHRGAIEAALGAPGAARRHLQEALRTDPAFSPLWAPRARAALAALGEPSPADAPAGVKLAAGAAPRPS